MATITRLPRQWLPIATVPPGIDLEVCVIDGAKVHALVFPCRWSGADWRDPATGKRIDIEPTHWRKWSEAG